MATPVRCGLPRLWFHTRPVARPQQGRPFERMRSVPLFQRDRHGPCHRPDSAEAASGGVDNRERGRFGCPPAGRRASRHTTVVSPAARRTSPDRVHARSVWTRRDYGKVPESPDLIFVIGVPPSTTPEGLILAVSRLCLPLAPALKGEACARILRQHLLGSRPVIRTNESVRGRNAR